MRSGTLGLLAALMLAVITPPALADNPLISMQTSVGDITLELDVDRAPKSVANFLAYMDRGFYDGTVFHRVIDGFMIQGGGYTRDMQRKQDTDAPVENEADNGLKNLHGTLAMARTNQPHSATSQFFINLVDNSFLDHRDKTRSGWGYAVFGKVVDGMDVVDRIAGLATSARPDGMRDVPIEPPVIVHVTRVQ